MINGFAKRHNILEIVSKIIIILLVIYNIQYNVRNTINKNKIEEYDTNQIIIELEKEPYIERLSKISILLNIDTRYEDIEWIKYLTEETKKDYGIGKYELNERLARARILQKLQKISQKNSMEENQEDIQDFLDQEYKEIDKIIKNEKDKTRLSDEEIEEYINSWNRIINNYEKNSN